MSDIVERLRKQHFFKLNAGQDGVQNDLWVHEPSFQMECNDAADEITRLRHEPAALKVYVEDTETKLAASRELIQEANNWLSGGGNGSSVERCAELYRKMRDRK